MPCTIRMCLRQLPLRLKTMEQTWHLVAPTCIGIWWYRELRCWKHFPHISHLWASFPSSLEVVQKLYGSTREEDVWPLHTPKKPGHNFICHTFFNIQCTFSKTSRQRYTRRTQSVNFNLCEDYTISLLSNQINGMTNHLQSTNSTTVTLLYQFCCKMWNTRWSESHETSYNIHTVSVCMPMPWIWRKCRFMFPIRLRTSEQIWHVVSPMCIAMCNWHDFLWRNSLPQTSQRNVGVAATDDTLLHQLPITGGNNHTLVAHASHISIPPPYNSFPISNMSCVENKLWGRKEGRKDTEIIIWTKTLLVFIQITRSAVHHSMLVQSCNFKPRYS